MSAQSPLSLAERLERLESENRRFRRFGSAGLIIVMAVLVMGQSTGTRTVEANEFVLKDNNGRVRGKWSLLEQGLGSQLCLSNEQGKELLSLVLVGDTPFVSLKDVGGKERNTLTVSEGVPSLMFRYANEVPAVILLADKDDGGRFVLDDFRGQGRIQLALGKQGTGAAVALYNQAGKQQVTLSQEEGGSGLVVEDRDGFKTTIGTAQLVTDRTGETHKTSAAAITMFDKSKSVIWKAP